MEFGRVTTLTGKTDSGKSSVLRALRWLLANEPSGDDFIGGFGEAPFALTRLTIDDHTVTRKRGGKSNTYSLDGEEFKAFGTGVPKPIADLANVSDANFQSQFAAPLWFLDSPAEVSRRLNAIINLAEIDSALTDAAKEVRKSKTMVEVCQDRLQQAKAKKKELAWAKELDVKLRALDKLGKQIEELRLKASQIEAIAQEAAKARERVQRATEALLCESRAIDRASEAMTLTRQADRLGTIAREMDKWSAVLFKPIPDLERLDVLYDRWHKLTARLRTLESIWLSMQQSTYEIDQASMLLSAVNKELKKETVCPTCNRKL